MQKEVSIREDISNKHLTVKENFPSESAYVKVSINIHRKWTVTIKGKPSINSSRPAGKGVAEAVSYANASWLASV